MIFYELTYIVNPNFLETDLANLINKIKEAIIQLDGEIKRDSAIGKRRLSYPIKKEKEGYFLSLDFQLSSAQLEKLNHQLKGEKDVLRYLIITKKIPKLKPLRIRKVKAKIRMAERPKEKVKLEELDKKLEELLKE